MFFNVMKNMGSGLRPGYEANSHFDSDNKNIVSLGTVSYYDINEITV